MGNRYSPNRGIAKTNDPKNRKVGFEVRATGTNGRFREWVPKGEYGWTVARHAAQEALKRVRAKAGPPRPGGRKKSAGPSSKTH